MRTHYEGCWRAPGHHDCAIAMIESLLIENDSWERAVTEARGEAHEARGNVRKLQEAIMPLTLSRDICVDLLERAVADWRLSVNDLRAAEHALALLRGDKEEIKT